MSLISNNSIIIHLNNHAFAPGDTIIGTMEISVSATIKADGVSVWLLWVNKQDSISISTWSISQSKSRQYFFNQSIKIKWPGEYTSEKIPFTYTIPVSILPKKYGGIEKLWNLPEWAITLLNVVIQLLWARQSQNYMVPEFTLIARIDIPWWIDITESIPILIEQREASTINIPNLKEAKEIQNQMNPYNTNTIPQK